MHRSVKIVLVVLLCIPLAGCWDALPLEEHILILGIGIDQIPDAAPGEPKFEFTFVSPVFEKERTTPLSLRTIRAHSFCQAITTLEHTSPRSVFLGKVSFILFGRSAAEAGVIEHINEMLSYPEFRLTAYMLVAEEQAKGVLMTIPPGGQISGYISDMLRRSDRTGDAPPNVLHRFATRIVTPGLDAVSNIITPIGSLDPRPPENRGTSSGGSGAGASSQSGGGGQGQATKQEILQLAKIAIWQSDQMVGEISLEESHWLVIANGTAADLPLLLELPVNSRLVPVDGLMLLRILQAKPKWKLDLKDGKPHFQLSQTVELSIEEYAGSVDLTEEENAKELRLMIEEAVNTNTLAVIQKISAYGSDPLGLGQQMRIKFPEEWDEATWPKLLTQASFTVKTKVTISNLEIQIQGLKPSPKLER